MRIITKIPKSTRKVEDRSLESIAIENIQNIHLRELGIDPYEYDCEHTEEEQELINEAILLVSIDEEIPIELAKKIRAITGKDKQE